jgi:hypothetical protein
MTNSAKKKCDSFKFISEIWTIAHQITRKLSNSLNFTFYIEILKNQRLFPKFLPPVPMKKINKKLDKKLKTHKQINPINIKIIYIFF